MLFVLFAKAINNLDTLKIRIRIVVPGCWLFHATGNVFTIFELADYCSFIEQ
jgi:hypothetical protein